MEALEAEQMTDATIVQHLVKAYKACDPGQGMKRGEEAFRTVFMTIARKIPGALKNKATLQEAYMRVGLMFLREARSIMTV